jgi:TATA-binding protein-associated factor Taf7
LEAQERVAKAEAEVAKAQGLVEKATIPKLKERFRAGLDKAIAALEEERNALAALEG